MKHAALLCGALMLSACSTLSSLRMPQQLQPAGDDILPMAQNDLYLGVVDGLIHQERYQAAIAFLAKYQKAGPQNSRFKLLAGDALAGAGRTDDAIASYRGALASDRAGPAYNGIGRAEAARGHWGEAAESFRVATQIDPANPDYLNNLGYAELKQNLRGAELAQAADVLERAHELAPDSLRIRNNLALASKRAGRVPQYLTLLDTVTDPTRRRMLADFTADWTAGADSTVKGP